MGEIKKIRIGNDIRLAVDLRQYIGGNHLREREVYNPDAVDFENIDNNPFVNKKYEVYYPNQYSDGEYSNEGNAKIKSAIGIRSVKAYLINTSKESEFEKIMRDKNRFIARYPIEPCCGCFRATPYNVCNSGYPTYRAYPHRYCMAPYHGFGVNPDWHSIYHVVPPKSSFEYSAPVMATEDQNVVEVAFPAEAQRFTGVYKLIIVAKVYAPGFNMANLKTITVDMPDVFELVKTSEEGVDTGISMNVSHLQDVLTNIGTYPNTNQCDDIYVNSGEYDDNVIMLNRTDGIPVNVDTSEFTAWYEGD